MKKNYLARFFLKTNYLEVKTFLVVIFIFASAWLTSMQAQQTYTFTNCGATGSVGPTQTQINTAYGSTNLSGNVGVIGSGIQTWTVPTTGMYRISALGAQGGGAQGGYGALMQGDFSLTTGDVIRIVVGQQGLTQSGEPNACSGGGGSFVLKGVGNTTANILVIAGAGGGSPATYSISRHASIGTSGNYGAGVNNTDGAGGTNGNGGNKSVSANDQDRGAGGGGFFTDGQSIGQSGFLGAAQGGTAFVNGCGGGSHNTTGAPGSFGGGGAVWTTGYRAGGGGGGYSGGGGGQTNTNTNTQCGGGGGSYNSGTNQTNAVSTSTGHGRVIIQELCNITLSANGLSSLPALCSGNSITLTTNAVSNYSWSNSATSSSIVVSPTTTTTYSLGATSASNCTAYAAITITVNSSVPVLSVANTASASGGICPTQTVLLTASGALSYTWAGGSIPVTNGVVFSPTSAVNYTVTGVNGCGTATAVTSVSVHPFPTVNPVASTSTLCSGNSLTLTATGNATNYVWSGGIAPSGNGIGFIPVLTETYTVIGTSALSCTASATIPVTVFPTPINPPTANPALICIGGSSTLSASGASNYTWTSSSQTVNTSDFVVTPAVGTTTYTITKANSSCYDTQTISVVTNSLPTIFAIVTPTVVCALTPATLAVGGAQTYTWTAPGPQSYTFTGASPIVSPVGPTTYSVAASDGTCINTSTVFLNANPNPTIVASASTPTTCGGEPVTLSATGGINYSWTSSGTATASTQSFTDAPTVPTAYYVTGDNSFGCTSGASQIVLVLPSPTITTSSAQPVVCSGAPVVVSASGAGSYTWSANAGGVTTNTALVNPTNTASGPVTYTVEGTSASNICKSTQTVLVKVFVPTLAVGGNTNTCAGSTVNLAIIGGSSAWSWNTGSSIVNSQNVVATLTAPAVFTLSAISNSGTVNCPSTETVALGIYYNPTITAVAQRTAICKDESVDITAGGGETYVWNTGSTNTVLTVSPVGNIINYSVTGTDANGCSSTATVQIKISGCSGLTELNANNGINIYPNPNNGVFTIEANTAIQLNLVNELGQLVRVITLSDTNNHKVSVNDLAQGIYFISGQKDEVQIYQKIVVTK